MFSRTKAAMVVAEIFGTAAIAVAVYSMVARTSFPLFGGLAAGITLGLMTFALGKVSSVHLNPAVTVSLWTARKVKTTHAIVNLAAQALGGLLAYALLRYYLGNSLENLAQADFAWKVFFAEAVGGFVFLFGLTSALYDKREGGNFAFVAGGSLLLGILVASMGSNGVVNPAVAGAIRSWSWEYALGPIAGGIVGANLYAWLFAGDFPKVRVVRAGAAKVARPATRKAPAKRATAKKTTRSTAARRR